MEIILGTEQTRHTFLRAVVTLGNFDGLHLGHRRILRRVVEEASAIRGESVVVTFEPHPLKVLSPFQAPPQLTSFQEKMALIRAEGIGFVLCLPFTPAFSQLSPLEFTRQVLRDRLNAHKIIVGYNCRFGKGKSGNVETLKAIGRELGIGVEVIPPLVLGQTVISSSVIRGLLQGGKVEDAATLLGRQYGMTGKVVRGEGRGRKLGFPTANIDTVGSLLPAAGVYAVDVRIEGASWNGVASIGTNPTFSSLATAAPAVSFEVYILGFDRQIYGEQVEVRFLRRVRGESRFDSPSLLIEQIRRDIEWAEEHAFERKKR
jgi:riboflavin kinase / FMN adenylyltransferase